MALAAVLGYVGVNLHGKKVWEDTVKEMNQRGFPSTMKEALGEPPEGVVDVSKVQVVLDEIERIEMGNDPLGDIGSMELPGLEKKVYLDYRSSRDGVDPTVFFKEPITRKEAAERILVLLEPYEDRRRSLLAIEAARGAQRPNFVLIVADDLGWGDAGFCGHPTIRTPNLDRLARDGMSFEQAFLTCSSVRPTT